MERIVDVIRDVKGNAVTHDRGDKGHLRKRHRGRES